MKSEWPKITRMELTSTRTYKECLIIIHRSVHIIYPIIHGIRKRTKNKLMNPCDHICISFSWRRLGSSWPCAVVITLIKPTIYIEESGYISASPSLFIITNVLVTLKCDRNMWVKYWEIFANLRYYIIYELLRFICCLIDFFHQCGKLSKTIYTKLFFVNNFCKNYIYN